MNMTPDIESTALNQIPLNCQGLFIPVTRNHGAVVMVYEIQSSQVCQCIKFHRDRLWDARIAPVEYIEQLNILDQQLHIIYASALIMSLAIRSCL